ncbi:transposase [Microcoleus sp. FACHB-68]|uniref:transposase n=1 Tax=Microcoleus sp. FACHB-68 TaxID=2692826 RepID=UPI001682B00A|nr:transposase [Microcoleus sp. FACHB-68]MBD1937064.1 transposase [Microcoleus sp. FACHB-68]
MHKSVSSDLNNAAWQLIEAIVPAKSVIGHPRAVKLRDVVNAIFYVLRGGYLPLWQKLGIWQSLQDCLRTQ